MSTLKRTVRNKPPSTLTTATTEVSDIQEDVAEDSYSSDFEEEEEEYTNEDEVYTRSCSPQTPIDLGHGITMLVSEGTPAINCEAEPLSAEDRTEILSKFPYDSEELMVSDIYRLICDKLGTDVKKKIYLKIPVVLPETRKRIQDLFRFHVRVYRNGSWEKVPAIYEESMVKVHLPVVEMFMVYATSIPVLVKIPKGYTFGYNKKEQIKVEMPSKPLDSEMTLTIKVHRMDRGRVERYSAFDPLSFDGVCALTDILTVRHTMASTFNMETFVEFPLEKFNNHDDRQEIKCVTVDNGVCNILTVDKTHYRNGTVRLPYNFMNETSYQTCVVNRGTSNDKVREAALYEAGLCDKCRILMFFSKQNTSRWLTVEVVQAPDAANTVSSRLTKGFHQIINSMSEIQNLSKEPVSGGGSRIRIDFSGNIQRASDWKPPHCTFVYSSLSEKNYIQFQTQKAFSSSPYGIVTVKIGQVIVHEVHFNYPELGLRCEDVKNLYIPSTQSQQKEPSIEYSSSGLYSDTGYNTETDMQTVYTRDSSSQSSESGDACEPTQTTPRSDACEPTQTTPRSDACEPTQTTPRSDAREPTQTTPRSDACEPTQTTPRSDACAPTQTTPRSDARGQAQTTPRSDARGQAQTTPRSDARRQAQATPRSDARGQIQTTPRSDACGQAQTTPRSDARGQAQTTPRSDARGQAQTTPRSDARRQAQTTPRSVVREQSQTTPRSDVRGQAQTTPRSDVRERDAPRRAPDNRIQRPMTGDSSASKLPEPVHKIFSDESLLTFGEMISPTVCNKLLILLGFNTDKIEKIVKEARETNYSSEFLLLLRWHQRQRIRKSNTELIGKLKSALIELGRGDYVDAIRQAVDARRGLKYSDFD